MSLRPIARTLAFTAALVLAPFALLVLAPIGAQAQDFAVEETTIRDVHKAMDAGKLTCRTLVQRYLDRIAAYDQQGPALNTVQHLNPRALQEADSLDAALKGGAKRAQMHCVPVLLKDQIETRDMPTSYGSVIYKEFTPQRDATVVKRLESAGAIILAKTTMGEFASRYVGSSFGIVRNAYDPTRNPSGSSGGSGSGTAANFGLVGIGEDTGGSVRGPAAVNALVGLRPTLQLVSRFGMLPANPTQDTMGPMTRTVWDAALLLDHMAGYDPADPITAYSVGEVPPSYTSALKPDALRGARIGVLRGRPMPTVDSLATEYKQVRDVMDRALEDLRKQGATVIDSVTISPLAIGGVQSNDFETEAATDDYFRQHPNAPVRTLKEILLSEKVNPWRARGMMGYVGKTTQDAGYLTLTQRREALRVTVLKLMADHQLDAIVYATYDAPPTKIAADVLTNPRPADGYGRGDNRSLSPAIGFPALTVPAGFTSESLPVGMELLGRPWTEAKLLSYAYAYEQATRHRRPPPLTPPLRGNR